MEDSRFHSRSIEVEIILSTINFNFILRIQRRKILFPELLVVKLLNIRLLPPSPVSRGASSKTIKH